MLEKLRVFFFKEKLRVVEFIIQKSQSEFFYKKKFKKKKTQNPLTHFLLIYKGRYNNLVEKGK